MARYNLLKIKSFKQRIKFIKIVIDSFGKLPSGVLNGDITWLGEFNECRNKTLQTVYNFTGNYALLSKPLDPMQIFRPESGLSIRYGLCAPIECSANDLATIINLFILNDTYKINSTYIQFQTDKTFDQAALATL